MIALDKKDLEKIPVELNEAFEAIHIFFEAGLPDEHRKDLKKWLYYVINDQQYQSRFGASHVVANYEETIRLIKAAHALSARLEVLSVENTVSENDMIKERQAWDYYPDNLGRKSLLNPLKVINHLFKEISLDKYLEVLHEWLHSALSTKATHEILTPKEIIDVYRNLKKLYSATWLIYKRQIQLFLKYE
ncbi:hypothetical protein DIU31_006160 [Mucilaginibacter rubeus]|uniref:Uncharacterized protein n=1 Tax=Mucilaginibacter rubeus TaxID=2027860 RepID=A0AAE6MH19_9SPHI|nr:MULTISPECIES: hypothetical protein [Mucilaginibacter]QEM03125.1 hypothetical protein DIU31_006160 [Mucilaginibacter rubeus]QEM15743.1 hypothetical protein DIU38_006230 [Mucilaginibacter gossypii]QTE41516.1 hypothetical protein J3L19_21545 [Mucilaginibacter rubeus]QTE48122.1 hypothetical protein J3L21_21545 [Mucilaginibacter rubeus]QTE59513.1 hypothetical protein J3L23_13190 [Mucilaginibacter rubeus]